MARSGFLSSGASLFRASETTSQKGIFVAAGFLLVLALVKFAFQDTLWMLHPTNDLFSPWVMSNLFIDGKNPYSDTQDFAQIVHTMHFLPQDPPVDVQHVLDFYARIYPPTTLMLIIPLAKLSWHTAVYAYLTLSVAFLIAMVLVMASNLRYRWSDPRKLYFVGFALALAPLHFGIVTVNLNTLGIALLCAGAAFIQSRPRVSGVAIGIALCLKPQLAIFFFLYPWLRKKWKVGFTALAAGALISAISLLWLKFHNIEWFSAWRNEVHHCGTPPGGCTPFASGIYRLQFLNLQALAYQFTQSPEWSKILSLALFAVLAAVALYLIQTRVSDKNESAGIAIVSVLTLLPVYNNFYAGAILLFVVYWAVESWYDKRARIVQLCMLMLLIPNFYFLVVRLEAKYNLASNTIWNGFVMLRVIWIELIVLLLLFASLFRNPKTHRMSFV